jgi:signal peptidase I
VKIDESGSSAGANPGIVHRGLSWLLARAPEPDATTGPAVAAVDGNGHVGLAEAPHVRRRPSPGGGATPERRPLPGSPQPPAPDDARTSDRTARRRRLRVVLRLLVIGAIVAVTVVLLRTFVVQPYYIPSESMEPTLHGCKGCNDDHVLVDKISYRANDVHARDIVVFHRPKDAKTTESILIKRVIATAGDVLQLRKGDVLINGRQLVEPYVNKGCGPRPTQPLTSRTRWRIPSGDVFVMGDNRCDSYDSRAFGPIPTSSIVGRAFAIIWPLNRIRSL